MLEERGPLHPDYPDWREAYEASKTNGTALFMEYAHILTQGRRIEDVLSEQVDLIANQPSPNNAIQMGLLRLISTAHTYGGRILARLLPNLLGTDEVLYPHLKRLTDEHLIRSDLDCYVGFHELRSQFLCTLTHKYPPPTLQDTLTKLVEFLPLAELTHTVENVCRHYPQFADELVSLVAKRLNDSSESPADSTEIIRRLYMASEWHYAQTVKQHLDQYGVFPGETNVFAIELAPVVNKATKLLELEVFRKEAPDAFASAPVRALNRFE